MVLPPGNHGGRYSSPLTSTPSRRSCTFSKPPLECPPPMPQTSYLSHTTTIANTDEPVVVAMARCLRVEGLCSRSPPWLSSSLADASSSTHSTGLANIGRLNWLKSVDSHSRRISPAHSYLATPHEAIEAGKSLCPQMSETTSRGRSLVKNSDSAPFSVQWRLRLP
jgi:hypothetical protein